VAGAESDSLVLLHCSQKDAREPGSGGADDGARPQRCKHPAPGTDLESLDKFTLRAQLLNQTRIDTPQRLLTTRIHPDRVTVRIGQRHGIPRLVDCDAPILGRQQQRRSQPDRAGTDDVDIRVAHGPSLPS